MLQCEQLRALGDHSIEACEKPRPQNPIPRGFRIDVTEGEQAALPRPGHEHTKQSTIGQAPIQPIVVVNSDRADRGGLILIAPIRSLKFHRHLKRGAVRQRSTSRDSLI
jgi:hypothetical protein